MSELKPLAGLKIVFTAVDLEQSEHRGIAYFSKSLINSLDSLGAEVYLLTGYSSFRIPLRRLRRMPAGAMEAILLSDILERLCNPAPSASGNSIASGAQFIANAVRRLRKILAVLRLLSSIISKKESIYLPLRQSVVDQYLGNDRIDYLQRVKGIISIPSCYVYMGLYAATNSILAKPRFSIPAPLPDLVITSCPLACGTFFTSNRTKIPVLQVLHDMFTLEYANHPDNPYRFYNRLKWASKSLTLCVSKDTQEKISSVLESGLEPSRSFVLEQPPSIDYSLLKRASEGFIDLGIKSPYILFNSSVVPRKNVDLLISSYLRSGLDSLGVQLIIAGKLHPGAYGRKISTYAESCPLIKLMGYVSDLEKAWLYLNALLLVSPSLSEGFGIPVLDAAALGVHVLASDIPSHREIASISTLQGCIELVHGFNIDNWSLRLRDFCHNKKRNEGTLDIDAQKRIAIYQKSYQQIKSNFDAVLCRAITQAIH